MILRSWEHLLILLVVQLVLPSTLLLSLSPPPRGFEFETEPLSTCISQPRRGQELDLAPQVFEKDLGESCQILHGISRPVHHFNA